MSTEQSIVVVDDAKFSAAIVAKRLQGAGYEDIRIAHHANEALDLIAEKPCDLIIADWLMPDIDGIELCQAIRELDRMQEHFTYCLLITAKEGAEALQTAFKKGLDDYIVKTDLGEQLIPRVSAGLRLGQALNASLVERQILNERIDQLEALQARDEATGLGNKNHAQDALVRTLRHSSSRGGATSYMTVQILNWGQIESEYKKLVCKELSVQIAKKLGALVRPLDEVCQISESEYGVVAHFADSRDCNLSTYRRIHQGLDNQAFKTSAGFISVSAACAICFIDQEAPELTVQTLCEFNKRQLVNCADRKPFVVSPWANAS